MMTGTGLDERLPENPAVTYARWIERIGRDIALGNCPDGVIEHIQKHAGPDLMAHVLGDKDWRRWSASMHNLLAIFDWMYLDEGPISTNEKLERLQEQYDRKPNIRTPPP